MDCTLPAGVHEPSGFDRAYIAGARGRFYRVRWDTVIVEPRSHSTWSYTRVPVGTEVATATSSGLPTATTEPPLYFSSGEPIHRDQNALLRGELGAGERWIPAIAIVGERLVHGWAYGIDLMAIGASLIAGNALRYDIEVQRCAQAAAAPLEHQAARTSTVTTEVGTPASTVVRNLNLFRAPDDVADDGAKGGADEQPTVVKSGMAVAIVGTLVAVGALGLIVWAASGDSR